MIVLLTKAKLAVVLLSGRGLLFCGFVECCQCSVYCAIPETTVTISYGDCYAYVHVYLCFCVMYNESSWVIL